MQRQSRAAFSPPSNLSTSWMQPKQNGLHKLPIRSLRLTWIWRWKKLGPWCRCSLRLSPPPRIPSHCSSLSAWWIGRAASPPRDSPASEQSSSSPSWAQKHFRMLDYWSHRDVARQQSPTPLLSYKCRKQSAQSAGWDGGSGVSEEVHTGYRVCRSPNTYVLCRLRNIVSRHCIYCIRDTPEYVIYTRHTIYRNTLRVYPTYSEYLGPPLLGWDALENGREMTFDSFWKFCILDKRLSISL